MMFDGTLKNPRSSQFVDCSVLFDSGATVCFVNTTVCEALHLTVHPNTSPMTATTADGRSVTFEGYTYVSVHLQDFSCMVKCWVGNLGDHCLILGDTWFQHHKVVLDWGTHTATLKTSHKTIVLHAQPHHTPFTPSKISIKAITARQFAKQAGKHQDACFMVRVTHVGPFDPGQYQFNLGTIKGVPYQPAASQQLPRPPHRPKPTDTGSPKPPQTHSASQMQPDTSNTSKSSTLMSQAQLDGVLHDFKDLFPEDLPHLAPVRELGATVPPFTIPLEPNTHPPWISGKRLSPAEVQEVDKQLKALLQKGLIEPSSSPYGAPVLFVSKPDGSLRMCIDYRALNKITVKNRYPIPRIDDLLDQLNGAKVFSSLDLMSGYWQLRMDPADVPKTAFRVPQGHYQWKVLPFGLTNAPAKFQSTMNTILAPLIGKCCLVYLDDILIFSRTAEEHEQHLRQVFALLRHYKFYCKLSKCDFNKAEVKYLGHIVGADGIKVDPAKVATVASWPTPQNAHDIRQFLGLANYFRRFIQGFASLTAPLTALLKGHTSAKKGKPAKAPPVRPHPKKPATVPAPFIWTTECQEAFDSIKWSLTHAPVLAAPILGDPFTIICDASQKGIGALLLQRDRPIAYESRKLTPSELNYDTGESELLAVIHALDTWRCYVEGVPFTLMTDHSPNTFFATKTTLSRRQARWQLFLALFPLMQWQYLQGHRNIADPLSRLPSPDTRAVCTPTQQLSALIAVVTRSAGRSPATSLQPYAPAQQLSGPPAASLPSAAASPHLPAASMQQPDTGSHAFDTDATNHPSMDLLASHPEWKAKFKASYRQDPYFHDKDRRSAVVKRNGLWYHRSDDKLAVPFPHGPSS
jgi:Reverse transcriptase (RNA-dependent DNA polymerase)/RNase H-like domain found in reverse transcriptase/Retroviral aspartyl protease